MQLALPSFASELCASVVAVIATINLGRGRRLHIHDSEREIALFTARIRARASRPYIFRVTSFLSRWMRWG